MAQFKLVLSDPKTAKSQVIELKDSSAQVLLGKRIGDIIEGSMIGIQGKFMITGGSDKAGFPMRADVHGGVKKYVLLTKGVGLKKAPKGEKIKKLVRGNIITEEIFQVNAKILHQNESK
jgi:small subunit ribosomal protein S6e